MKTILNVATILSGVLFLWYGSSSLLSDAMLDDFERFGLSRYRRLTGGLELLGGLGLLAGLLVRPLAVLSAASLSLMMFFGVVARVRVRDPWNAMVPAVVLMVLNLFVAVCG